MRQISTQISSRLNKIGLGTITEIPSQETIAPLNSLIPYAAKSEDFEVILKNEKLLSEKQPVEMNGFNSHVNMKKAIKIGGEAGNIDSIYTNFTIKHPLLLSFPSEVIWLGIGVDEFKDSFDWAAKKSDLGIDPKAIEDYSSSYKSIIERNTETYGFWKQITSSDKETQLSRVLLETTLNMALLTRATFLSGITPLITKNSTTVGVLSQRINLAYGALINDYEDIGEKCPKYLYTINMDSSIIPKDNFTDELQDILSRARVSLETDTFNGIFVSVRGLKNLSSSEGRVNTLKKFFGSLCDIASDEKLPIWFSRTGLISLSLFELGGNFGSYQLNNHISDIYTKGFAPKGPSDPKMNYGTVLDPDTYRILTVHQVLGSRHGLTQLEDVPNLPDEFTASSSVKYRKKFSKPYNMAAMQHINKKWLKNVEEGETNPGSEYLSRFSEPSYLSNWGI